MSKFQPGQSGNPGGGWAVPAALRGVRLLGKGELRALMSKFLRMDARALQIEIDKTDVPALEAAIAQQVLKAAQKGDAKAFQFLLDYAGCRPDTGVSIGQSDATLALDNMSTSELLDVVRKSLPAAQDLPEIKDDAQVSVSTTVSPNGSQSSGDSD